MIIDIGTMRIIAGVHTMSPSRLSSFVEPILKILIIVFIFNFIYNWIVADVDEDDTVTITFRCKQVLDMQNSYPDFVVQQCKQIKIK
jgi:hypothetical protein